MFESSDRDGCDLVTVNPPEMVRKPSAMAHRSMIGADRAQAATKSYPVSAAAPGRTPEADATIAYPFAILQMTPIAKGA